MCYTGVVCSGYILVAATHSISQNVAMHFMPRTWGTLKKEDRYEAKLPLPAFYHDKRRIRHRSSSIPRYPDPGGQ